MTLRSRSSVRMPADSEGRETWQAAAAHTKWRSRAGAVRYSGYLSGTAGPYPFPGGRSSPATDGDKRERPVPGGAMGTESLSGAE